VEQLSKSSPALLRLITTAPGPRNFEECGLFSLDKTKVFGADMIGFEADRYINEHFPSFTGSDELLHAVQLDLIQQFFSRKAMISCMSLPEFHFVDDLHQEKHPTAENLPVLPLRSSPVKFSACLDQ
jgi:hypothetical protein